MVYLLGKVGGCVLTTVSPKCFVWGPVRVLFWCTVRCVAQLEMSFITRVVCLLVRSECVLRSRKRAVVAVIGSWGLRTREALPRTGANGTDPAQGRQDVGPKVPYSLVTARTG